MKSMHHRHGIYINGRWSDGDSVARLELVDPARESVFLTVGAGGSREIDRACQAASAAAPRFASISRGRRRTLLARLLALYTRDREVIAGWISREMGAPIALARGAQWASGSRHLTNAINLIEHFAFESRVPGRSARILHEPIGVAGLITPWNWPMNQIMAKLAPALATGCTVVLKPSEIAAASACHLTELVAEAGYPAGVFNLVCGYGAEAGLALAAHPLPQLLSLTGSPAAGRAVSEAAAPSVKRVVLELGGKSPHIVFADADVCRAVRRCVRACCYNSGQSCNAPTRLLIQRAAWQQAIDTAVQTAERYVVATPDQHPDRHVRHVGPLASEAQYHKVQAYIRAGQAAGATLLTGGPDRPAAIPRGFYVRPTVFIDVDSRMSIWREEIFGPVLCIHPFDDENDAIELANDSPYGLAAYIDTGDADRAERIARRLSAGMVHINGATHSSRAPFGGYKASGIGREYGEAGFYEYLETKVISTR